MHYSLNTKIGIAGGLLAGVSLFGLYCYDLGKKSVKPVVKIETKTEEKVQYVDRLTTRTIKGDTVTEVIHEKGKTETKTVEKEVPIKEKLTRYSVSGHISFDPIAMRREYQVMAGARLGDLPLFIEAGATSRKEILLGVRFEF